MTREYGKVTPEIVAELRGAAGARNVVTDDKDTMENYSYDEAGQLFGHMPDVVIRVDNTTGVPDIVTAITDKAVTGDEVMDKYWLAQYVRARETYDWYTLQRDYNTVGLLSSANVGQGYAQLFEGKDALDKTYGKTVRATVEILSVVPTGKNTGTVRFIKTTKRVDQEGAPGTVTKWVATVAYEYRSTALIKESARLVNPFGFQVLTYRVDPEMVGSVQ